MKNRLKKIAEEQVSNQEHLHDLAQKIVEDFSLGTKILNFNYQSTEENKTIQQDMDNDGTIDQRDQISNEYKNLTVTLCYDLKTNDTDNTENSEDMSAMNPIASDFHQLSDEEKTQVFHIIQTEYFEGNKIGDETKSYLAGHICNLIGDNSEEAPVEEYEVHIDPSKAEFDVANYQICFEIELTHQHHDTI